MRKKIAMKCRRQLLRHGAEILKEGMIKGANKQCKYNLLFKYKDWVVHAFDSDMLSSYKISLFVVKCYDQYIQQCEHSSQLPSDQTSWGDV